VDVTGSRSCPMANFCISSIERSGSTVWEGLTFTTTETVLIDT
jgi:hypothetical protein